MSGHTPAPWHVQKSDHEGAGLLIKPIPGQVVAECDPLPEMEANARLIAASPNLLEAAEYALKVLRSPDDFNFESKRCAASTRLAEAIAIALGEK